MVQFAQMLSRREAPVAPKAKAGPLAGGLLAGGLGASLIERLRKRG